MRRSVLLSLSIGSTLALLATACMDDSTEYRTADDYLRPVRLIEDDDNDDDRPTSKTSPASSSATRPPAPAKPMPAPSTSGTTSSAPPATCDPGKTTTKADCQRCCAAKPAPAAPPSTPAPSCACGAGSKCAALCESSVCRGEPANVACGICLLVAKCDPSDEASTAPAPDACPSVCNGKP